MNVAHNFFIQDKPHLYKEAIKHYEPIVKKSTESVSVHLLNCYFANILQLLSVTAIVLANLCVSYIMTSNNEEAEEVMRKIEKEEERVGFQVCERNGKTKLSLFTFLTRNRIKKFTICVS